MTASYKLALAAGHHNSDGGNQVEAQETGELCASVAKGCRDMGFDVRVITPNEGRGMFPGGLDDVAQQVVDWAQQSWTADIFLECHTEGVADPNVRGVFGIYPDWGEDVDADVRDRLGPDVAARIAAATGLPVRGIMSERRTGVGIEGFRLGIFRVTEPVRTTTTRLIIEYGSHSSPADLAIINSAGFYDKAGAATAQAFAAFLGLSVDVVPPPDPAFDAKALDAALKTEWGHALRTGFGYLYGNVMCGGEADLSVYGAQYPKRVQCLVFEKTVTWTVNGEDFDAMHRGQWESLKAMGRGREWK